MWTKPGIRKWTNKDLPIVCLAQQQPWGAKNISRIMWTMLTLIPITNKDIRCNRKIFLRTDSCFEHWALIQCPFDLEKNWYCRIWSRLETNHRNEDGQSAASELICELRRVCEFIRAPLHKSSSWDWDAEVRYMSNIRADRFFRTSQLNEWSSCHERRWSEKIETESCVDWINWKAG